jgi:hypothetical protein
MNNVRVILACETARLDAARITLAYAEFAGFNDVGEVDNLTPASQIVNLVVGGVTTEYRVVDAWVPQETAVKFEELFDPPPALRATWNDRIDAQRTKIATLRAIRAKVPNTRTDEEARLTVEHPLTEPADEAELILARLPSLYRAAH